MAKTLAEITAKYLKGVQSAGDTWVAGVNGVTVNPAEVAIQNAPYWESQMQKAIAEQRYQKGLSKVQLPDWKKKTTDAKSKFTGAAGPASQAFNRFAQQAMPVWQQARDQVKGMPKGSREDAINRVRANLDIMDTLKGVRG